jgi:hypothetical protein
MIKVLPFSALKRHLQGEIFTPVDMGAHYELQSAARVMCGSNGNTYRFKTAENAALWLDTNTIKAVKNQITKQSAIDSLIIKNMGAPSDWLAEEIATLQARANGDWAAFHTGEDLLAEWGIIAKGDKGDKGDAGEAGAVRTYGNELTLVEGVAHGTLAHGLPRMPDDCDAYFQITTTNGPLIAGDRIKAIARIDHLSIGWNAQNVFASRLASAVAVIKPVAVNLSYNQCKLVVKPYIYG